MFLIIANFASLMDSKDFPKVSSCSISGSQLHGSPLEVSYVYSGGVEGNSSIRWERSSEDEKSFIPIKKASGRAYTPSINDIGALIRVAYTPVRADGVTGMIVFSKPIKVKIAPSIKSEVESNLSMSTLMFKVFIFVINSFTLAFS